MQAKDIRELNEGDINARIAELERERFNLRLASGTRTLEDPLRLRVIRKDIARLNTVMREKVMGIAESAAPVKTKKARRVTGRRGRKSATATNQRAKTKKRA
jgi:large subunit ribosomal protein L29